MHGRAAPRWDVIVIGSGLGGLTAAAHLAARGRRTLVLEQAAEPGGCGRALRADGGFAFDVGVHYLGDCEEDGAIPSVLRGAGVEVDFLALDPDGFDRLVFPGLTLPVPRGWGRYRDRLVEAFPAEAPALRRCLGVLERIGREMEASPAPTRVRSTLAYPLRAPMTVRWGLRPLRALFDACGLGPEPRAVIAAQSGNYGTPAARAPAAMHAGMLHHFLKAGAFYPRGGGEVIAARLVEAIRARDGEVRTGARVERILVEGRRVTGVRLAGGERIPARLIVSNADLPRTHLELVGREHLARRTAARLARFRMAPPLLSVHLGLETDLRDRLPVANHWLHPAYDEAAPYRAAAAAQAPGASGFATPAVFVTSGSLKDPTSGHAPAGAATIEAVTIVPAAGPFWGVNGDRAAIRAHAYAESPEYRATKEAIAEAVVDRVDALVPGVRDHIVHREVATPVTHDRIRGATGGGAYGLEVATDQFGPRRPGPRTAIGGLYLAGASTVWGPGVVGVLTGGAGTAAAVLEDGA